MVLRPLQNIFDRKSVERRVLTRRWLENHGIRNTDFQIHIVDVERIESTEDYLKAHGVGRAALITDELRKAEAEHRLNSRKLILLSLVVPMSIAPFWLMALLSLPAFDKKPYSETMQVAFLTALVSDFVGLYYVITRDLFPRGETSRRNAGKDEAGNHDKDQDNGKA